MTDRIREKHEKSSRDANFVEADRREPRMDKNGKKAQSLLELNLTPKRVMSHNDAFGLTCMLV